MNVKQTVPLLAVTDIRRSVEFYCQGLGFQIIGSWEPDGKLTWCWLQSGDAALMLQQPDAVDEHAAHWGKGVEESQRVEKSKGERAEAESPLALRRFDSSTFFASIPS